MTEPSDAPPPGSTPTPDSGILDALVDAAPAGMARLDANGRILHVNSHWATTTGQDPVDAHGHGWTSILDPDGRDEFLADLRRGLADGSGLHGRLRLLDAEGTTRWLDLSTVPLDRVDGSPGALLTVTDVTDEMDEARRAHELTRVLEASPDPVAVLEPSGEVVVWANDAMRRLTGNASTVTEVRLLDVLDG